MPSVLLSIAQAEAKAHRCYGTNGLTETFGPLVAVYAGQDSPLSTAWHDGSRSPEPEEWDAFEAFAQQYRIPARVQLLSHAAPSLLPALNERGYRLNYLLHLYTHPLTRVVNHSSVHVVAADDPERWAQLSAQGFGGGLEIMRKAAAAKGTQLFIARLGEHEAGTAALSVTDGMAALHSTSTRPDFRGRGVQQALLAHRLIETAGQGAKLATVFVTPGTPSERNITQAGFGLAGMRLTLTRSSGA